MNAPFKRVGKVKDAHGIKGELFIVLFAGEAAWLNKLTTLRLVNETDAEATPRTFTVKSVRAHKNGLIAKTQELHDRNHAEELKGLLLEIPTEFLRSEKGESIYLSEIQGFRIFVKGKGEVGQIVNFGSNGAQDLLIVNTRDGEFEIPFVEAFVENIDYEAGQVHLDLPVGLLGELDDESVVQEQESDDVQ